MTQTDVVRSGNDVNCNNNSCLICCNLSVSNLKCDLFEKSPSQKDPDEEILKPHLWSMFVLTKVLQYPREKCSEMLLKTCGVSNPGDWFTLCDQCCSVVNNAYQLSRQMYKLGKQLQHLRNDLTVKLGKSFEKEQETNDEDNEMTLLNVRLEIRNYFRHLQIAAQEIKLENGDIEISSPSMSLVSSTGTDEENTETGECHQNFDFSENPPLDNNSEPHSPLNPGTKNIVAAKSSSSKPSKRVVSNRTTSKRRPPPPDGPNGAKRNRRYRTDAWLEASDEESGDPKKWKSIDKDLYYIYMSFPADTSSGKETACPICGYMYRHIRQHLRSHRARYAQFACSICKYAATSQTSLNYHKAIRHKELGLKVTPRVRKEYRPQCQICKHTYSSDHKLREHLAMHKKYSNFTCPTCHYPCVSEKNLRNHTKLYHTDSKRSKLESQPLSSPETSCHICTFSCRSLHQLEDHLITKHRPTINVPKKHVIRHSVLDNATVDESAGSYCCKSCSAKFRNDISFATHFFHAHKSELTHDRFMCHLCDKTYISEPCLKVHIRKVHPSQVPKPRRRVVTSTSKLLSNRRRKSAGAEQNRLQDCNASVPKSVCDQCGMTFSQRGSMELHQRKFHQVSSKSTKKCEHCGITCVHLRAFKDHLKVAHPNLYKFHCTLCPAKYISGSNLRLHMKSCHGTGKESCKWCGVQLKSYSMNEHLKNFCKQNPERNTNP